MKAVHRSQYYACGRAKVRLTVLCQRRVTRDRYLPHMSCEDEVDGEVREAQRNDQGDSERVVHAAGLSQGYGVASEEFMEIQEPGRRHGC